MLETIHTTLRPLLPSIGTPVAIGVACAGQIHPDSGAVVYAPNLDWFEVPLREWLSQRLSASVVVENDVRAAAWGEFRFGAAMGAASAVTVFVGTGVGSGAVLGGALWRGQDNAAGEIGHTQVVPGGRPCPCGRRGCLEQYASGSGFQRRLQETLDEADPTVLSDLTDGRADQLTAAMVAEAAAAGDTFAEAMRRDAAWTLSVALGNCVTLLNPEVLVLGGGVIESMPGLFEEVAAGTREATTILARRSLRIERARLGGWSGVVGAAALAAGAVGPPRYTAPRP